VAAAACVTQTPCYMRLCVHRGSNGGNRLDNRRARMEVRVCGAHPPHDSASSHCAQAVHSTCARCMRTTATPAPFLAIFSRSGCRPPPPPNQWLVKIIILSLLRRERRTNYSLYDAGVRDNLLITRISAPFSSFSRRLSFLSSCIVSMSSLNCSICFSRSSFSLRARSYFCL
jgi:hypothetical protein